MSMVGYFRRMFSYDDWANREVVAALQGLKTVPPRSLKYLAHIVSAERLWLDRLRANHQSHPVWADFTLEQSGLEISELGALWKSYLDSLPEAGLAGEIAYKNSKGESWASQKQDVLMHVILHSAYHRGQIAADIRAAGFTPPNTDFIHAIRQGLVE